MLTSIKIFGILIAGYLIIQALSYAKPLIQVLCSWLLLIAGIVIAVVFGTTTELAFPGLLGTLVGTSIAAGIGWGFFLLIGPQGIVPLGIAIGVRLMIGLFGGVGAISSLSAGFGMRTVISPQAMFFWVPLLIIGFIAYGRAKRLNG